MTHANISPCHSECEVQEGQLCPFLLQFLACFCTVVILRQFLWLFFVFGILLGRDLWIPGGGGVHRLVLRGAGVGNCPEIAHCHCPPSLPIAPSLLHVSTESKNAVSSPLSENTPSYRVSWHGEGSNYESNQPWNAPISCFRPCLMLEINYTHASDKIIIPIDIIIVSIILDVCL